MSAQNILTITDAKKVWKAVLAEMELELSDYIYKMWLEKTYPENIVENIVETTCLSKMAMDQIEKKYLPLLTESFNRISKGDYKIKFVVREERKEIKPEEMGPLFAGMPTQGSKIAPKELLAKAGLSAKYTFENYLSGNNNQLAFAIAHAVAQNPGNTYNPVFFYSGVGLGKTHLVQAIGNQILAEKPNLKVYYCTGEAFANELIDAIQNGKGRGKTTEFREKYRKFDVLIIDDIQFIAGKESTQQEFFHTFNDLHIAQKQIVLTSDRPPKDLKNIAERITSRFSMGIIADIQTPDTDMRIALLRKKRDQSKDDVPNEVINFIAENIDSNIRELEGAYLQVLIYAKTAGAKATIELAAFAIGQNIKIDKKKPVNVNRILKAVCNYYSVKTADIKGERRTREFVIPRQIAMYLIKEMTETPYLTIGEFLGGRDHTTIMHGVKKIEAEVVEMGKTKQDLTNIKQMIFTAD